MWNSDYLQTVYEYLDLRSLINISKTHRIYCLDIFYSKKRTEVNFYLTEKDKILLIKNHKNYILRNAIGICDPFYCFIYENLEMMKFHMKDIDSLVIKIILKRMNFPKNTVLYLMNKMEESALKKLFFSRVISFCLDKKYIDDIVDYFPLLVQYLPQKILPVILYFKKHKLTSLLETYLIPVSLENVYREKNIMYLLSFKYIRDVIPNKQKYRKYIYSIVKNISINIIR